MLMIYNNLNLIIILDFNVPGVCYGKLVIPL